MSKNEIVDLIVARLQSEKSPASPTGEQYFNVTSFSARPEQTARRVLAWADNKLRQGIRALVTGGVGPKDVYMAGGR